MRFGPATLGSLGILAGLIAADPARAQIRDRPNLADSTRGGTTSITRVSWNAPIAIDALPTEIRGKIAKVVQSPTMTAKGPAEEFPANFYEWLLDHPDRVALAWRRLGVPCVGITQSRQRHIRLERRAGQRSHLALRLHRAWHAHLVRRGASSAGAASATDHRASRRRVAIHKAARVEWPHVRHARRRCVLADR